MHWLVKSEPTVWSWDQQVKQKETHWDGVRNYQAAANLKAMRVGDLAFFYHSGDEKQIVGIVEVIKEAYPDPTDESGKFVMVNVRTVRALQKPVTLQQIKAREELQHLALVKQARLSVMAVDDVAWDIICKMEEQ